MKVNIDHKKYISFLEFLCVAMIVALIFLLIIFS